MYIIKECDFRLVSTGTYYLVPAPIFVQKALVFTEAEVGSPYPNLAKFIERRPS